MKLIFSALLVCFLQNANAATYYFSSNSGDDSRSSTEARNSSTPWKSLSKLNSFFSSLQPGDQVLLKRGETYYGSILVNKSGTAGSPIFIGAYGSGNKPVVTSLVTFSGWVSKGNGIWESYNSSLPSKINMVLVNGAEQEMGRYPNSNAANKGYLTFESHSGTTSITDKSLSSSPNWTGAEMVLRIRRWIIDRDLIKNHSGNKITYAKSSSYEPRDGYGYFIQNSIKTLDKFGEWYYNPSTKKISVYFGSNSPSSNTVQAATKDNLIYAPKFSNVVFDNLNIKGANASGVYIRNGGNIHLENCDIQYSGNNGVEALYHDNFKIENSTVAYSNYGGIYLGYSGDNAVIRNNKITNTCTFSGMGASGDGQGIGIFTSGNGSTIEYNQLINTGWVGINFNGENVTIKNNLVDNFAITRDDGAGIYTYVGSKTVYLKGRKLIGNIVLNGRGAPEGVRGDASYPAEGIYLDNGASGVELTGNTVGNCSNNGVYIHCAHEITMNNNTIFSSNNRQVALIQLAGHPKIRNCNLTNNIFFSNTKAQNLVYSLSNTTDISSFGKFSGNHYARPSDNQNSDFLKKIRATESGASLLPFNNPVRFEYNATTQTKTVSLGANYVDVKNNKYSGSVTLQPFTSVVLIKTSGGGGNSSPSVNITSPEQGTSYNPGASITIGADASDPDGSIKKVEFYNGSKLLDTETGSRYSFVWNNVSAGNYTITAKATDNSGSTTTSDGVSISVGSSSSSNPTVSLTSPNQNASYKTGASINISADASDADGSVEKVAFYNGSTLLHTETTRPYIWDWNNVKAGNYTITAKATDNSGNTTTSDGVSISVGSSSSSNPTVSLTSPTQNASYRTGATINISANASDADGSVEKVAFYNGSTLLHTETTRPYIWDWNNVKAGNYTITAKATDNSGNTTTSSGVSISVGSSSSSNPTVSLRSPTEHASYKTGATINISANASDPDGSIKTVKFYNGSTLLHTETGRPYSWDWNNVRAGNYTITAKATDNSGNTSTSASVSISVGSSSSSYPAVSLTSPKQNGSYSSRSTINISANASDADGSVKTVQFYNGNTLLHTETGRPFSWDWKNVAAGKYTITAKATDDDGHSTTSSGISITVGSNNISSRPLDNVDAANSNKIINADKSADFRLFPNPSVNTIKVNFNQLPVNQKANLSIQSVSGSILKSIPVILSGQTIDIDISSLSPGIYIMRIAGDNFGINKKFVKIN